MNPFDVATSPDKAIAILQGKFDSIPCGGCRHTYLSHAGYGRECLELGCECEGYIERENEHGTSST